MVIDGIVPIVQNLYKGDVYIITSDQGQSFQLIFENLPQEVSVTLGSSNWGIEDISGLQQVSINGDATSSNSSE